MYLWNEALAHDGRLLSQGSLKQMFDEYPEATYQGQHYGYGVVISRQKFGKLLHYHGGGVEGFSSSIQRYPNERACIVVLSNLSSFKPWEMSDPVLTEFGYHLILAVDAKAGVERKFEDLKDVVRDVYAERMRQVIVQQMKPQAKIVVNPVPK